MSVHQDTDTEAVVYVRLLDEGTDVWRPARATALPDGTFQLLARAERLRSRCRKVGIPSIDGGALRHEKIRGRWRGPRSGRTRRVARQKMPFLARGKCRKTKPNALKPPWLCTTCWRAAGSPKSSTPRRNLVSLTISGRRPGTWHRSPAPPPHTRPRYRVYCAPSQPSALCTRRKI